MFKKKFAAIIAAALMTLSASSAFAAFSGFDLIRVISDKTTGSTLEIATNLGNIDSLAALHGVKVGDSFLPYFGSNPDLTKLAINYYAVNKTGTLTGTIYLGTKTATGQTSPGKAQAQTPLTNINAYYTGLSAAQGNAATVVANNTATGSFGKTYGLNALGSYGGFATPFSTDASFSLSALANGAIKESVWQYGVKTGSNVGLPAQINPPLFVLDLYTNADGTTTINSAPVANTPIPAAAWLLGSGLMGLFGLRRKMNA